MMQFPLLFQPIRIGPVELPNRLFLAAHGTNYPDGAPTERLIRYYQERARGGVGLIITEAVVVHPTALGRPDKICGWHPETVPAYRRMADALHAEGTRVFAQIQHTGRQMTSFWSRQPVWAPSPIPCAEQREMPHVMTRDEIREVIEHFAVTAAHCRAGGIDGVEIHAAHGYLVQQFLSPASNQRDDEYGGSLENRLRFARETLAAVRREVGRDYVVGMRISADELLPGGLTLDDMCQIVSMLEAEGNLDYVSVAISTYSYHGIIMPDMFFPSGTTVHLAAGLKQAGIQLPVLVAGKIKDPGLAEAVLANGQADMIGMARALIADPALPRKARQGRQDEIRPCISCNQECRERLGRGAALACLVNPAAGLEAELGEGTLTPAARVKKVVIVGGGPAGMECALTAVRRGHEVVLFEQGDALGGQVRFAATVPSRAEFGLITQYLAARVQAEGVQVRLGTAATPAAILAEEPDAVVVATGARPRIPDFPGAEAAVTVWDALQGRVEVGRRVVVADDYEGFWPFCSTLDYLSEQGHQVEAVTRLGQIGASIPALSLPILLRRLTQRGVVLTPMHRLEAIQGTTVLLRHVYTGAVRELVDVDTVVLAAGALAEDGLAHALKGRVPELHCIGDALAPRRAADAIREGHYVARSL